MDTNGSTDSELQKASSKTRFLCPDGGCVWFMTDEGWEHFDTCGDNCGCPEGPPLLPSISDRGKVIITLCDEVDVHSSSTILSSGFVAFASGFRMQPRFRDDYCAAISESPGKWRYCHRGVNIRRDRDKGHLDGLLLPRGVVRLDLLKRDGSESIELCGVGIIEPVFGCQTNVVEQLAKYRLRKSAP